MGCGASTHKPNAERAHPKLPDRWYEEYTGKCYYKSGWAKTQSEPNFMGKMGTDYRWVQLIHYVIYTYDEWQYWYNWGSNDTPKESDLPDGFSMPDIPGLPSMPSLSMPDMPDLPSMDMPDMPDMPSMDMPDMPSMDMPDMPDAPSVKMPKAKKRKPNGYPHRRIEIHNATVSKSGKKITLKGCKVDEYWEEETENKKDQEVTIEADNDEQAESWFESLKYGGAKEE